MANPRASGFDKLTPKGSFVESIVIKALEDPDAKAARLFREKWSFLLKELAVYYLSIGFILVIGIYCGFVVVRHGPISPEARMVFPLLTTLFGGVLGVIVGKAAK